MISYVSSHRNINTILVYSFDRFSRAGAEAIVTKAFLKSKGVAVVSVTQPIDSDNMAGEFLENMIFLFNEFENNLRKEKCTAGMVECLERGEWFTKPPVGYVIDRTTKEKHRLLIDEKGELLRMAFHWRANEGLSDAEIVRRLRLHGWEIYKQRLTDIFHNPFYCGKIRHHLLGDRIVQGIHPAIVDEETFNKVNGIDTHIGYVQVNEKPETPLKLLIRCDNCGRYLTGYEVKAKHLFYYKCCGKGCKSNISAKTLHQMFYEVLRSYSIPEDTIPMLVSILENEINQYGQAAAQKLEELKKQRGIYDNQLKRAATRYGIGDISEEIFIISKENLTNLIDEIDQKIKKAESSHSNQAIDVYQAILKACNLANYWRNSDYATKQKLQNFAFPGGLNYSKNFGITRTNSENEVLRIFHLFSEHYALRYN